MRRAKLTVLTALGALALALFAAWPATEAKSEPPRVNLPPQVEWVGQYRSAADVTGKPSRLKWIVKKIIGLDDASKRMVMPYGIAVDNHGRVLVADTRARVVHVFDAAGKKYRAIRAPDKNPFATPVGVAVDANDNIYVSDSERSRIFVFRPDGKYLREIGAISRDESIFKRSTGIAIDRQRGRLYVVDTIAMQVVVLDLEGHVLKRIGQRGPQAGQFNYPTQIAVAADGSLWVTDSLNFRVQHFSPEGQALDGFGRVGDDVTEFDKPKGIAVDARGYVLVVEGRNDRVQVYSPDGHMRYYFGQTGRAEAQFFLPTGITVDKSGTVYVADSYNSRVEIFHLRDAQEAAGR
jgi:DNA-binding beta-propeller fold protein YncE